VRAGSVPRSLSPVAPKKIMKFFALAMVGAAISKLVQGMKQGSTSPAAPATSGSADQWPPVPRRDEES